MDSRICEFCGNSFIPKRYNQKYCSKKCYYENAKKRAIIWDKNNVKQRQHTSKIYAEKNKKKIKKAQKEYYKKNKNIIVKNSKEYYQKNKKTIKENAKCYYQKNKKYIKEKTSQWAKNNKDKVLESARKRQKRKRKTNTVYRLNLLISCQIRVNLKRKKGFKTFDLLEYTSNDLKVHLESKFKEGMTWNNYGMHGWHIDHIKPVAAFKFLNEDGELDLEQIKECWSLNNLQPLWAKDNISKSNWYEVNGKMCRFSNGEIVEVREGLD